MGKIRAILRDLRQFKQYICRKKLHKRFDYLEQSIQMALVSDTFNAPAVQFKAVGR